MFNFIPTLFLTTSVAALVPQVHPDLIRRTDAQAITVRDGNDLCGRKLELQCCNNTDDKTSKNPSLLSGLLSDLSILDGEIDLFDQCSKLSVTALIGVDDILGSQCDQNIACCDTTAPQQNRPL
ncbi:unnamed protein product [Clonostachys chloroleuca]|uniref:Hydrophobin n=1 Tax=Clonostachys chloroleuca TaxID=1926264 RepID=A0AA35LQW2_9HYPO|nr:unnamed protein product [Clonostachys chloroleuca]